MDLVADATGGLAEIAGDYYWASRPTPEYHRAAQTMQRIARGQVARASFRATVMAKMKLRNRTWLRERPGFTWPMNNERKRIQSNGHIDRPLVQAPTATLVRALSFGNPKYGALLAGTVNGPSRPAAACVDVLHAHAGIIRSCAEVPTNRMCYRHQ